MFNFDIFGITNSATQETSPVAATKINRPVVSIHVADDGTAVYSITHENWKTELYRKYVWKSKQQAELKAAAFLDELEPQFQKIESTGKTRNVLKQYVQGGLFDQRFKAMANDGVKF